MCKIIQTNILKFFFIFSTFPTPHKNTLYAIVSNCKSKPGGDSDIKIFFTAKFPGENCNPFHLVTKTVMTNCSPKSMYIFFLFLGHKYPQEREMSHLQGTALFTQWWKDCAITSKLLHHFLMEHVSQNMQHKFILKPNHLAVFQKTNG